MSWIDPRPKVPDSEFVVLILGHDGSKRYGTYNKHTGWCTVPGGLRWSMAHPEVVGWKKANWPPQTEEEWQAATRNMSAEQVKQWRQACATVDKKADT